MIRRHGESACELFAFATAFFVFSSALSLLAVAIDRHISLLYPRAYRRRSHGGANILAAVLIWIIAFSISFPPVVGAGRYVFAPEEAHCAFQHSHYTKNDSLSSAIILLVILFITFLLYFRIYRFLRAHRRMRPLAHVPAQSASWTFVGQGANGQAFINWLNGFGGQAVRQEGQRVVQRLNFGRVVNLSAVTSKNEHLTRLFLILTLVFLFSWLPYIVVSLIQVFSSPPPLPVTSATKGIGDRVSPLSALISSWLGYAQVGLCPVAFFLFRGPAGRRRKDLRTDYSMELAETERHKFLLENPIRK
ncbi:melanopsin [Elysia marginata]|uniref:Melanopsin n=1 Tax=Elysia marginata TaxID=1093978 RepID=A0AAV4GT84_9GAST|nr:melanopsin [Elysia marginata]